MSIFSKIRFYFNLALFCTKLFFNLLSFSWVIFLAKINRRAILNASLLLLIASSLFYNFYLWEYKNTPQKKVLTQELPSDLKHERKTNVEVMTKGGVEEKLSIYQDLVAQGVQNQAVYINLAQIYELIGEEDLKTEALEKALRL